jgi:hypothetical protein
MARTYVEGLDFSAAKREVLTTDRGPGWSNAKADYVERQYKNWLYLCRKHESEHLVPSRDIDVFWHSHILDTKAYHRDCAAIFGYYVHHMPYAEDATGAADLDAWATTQRAYQEEFGELIYDFDAP